MKTIIFDIDGTLADNTHRQHHLKKDPPDWNAFFEEMDKDVSIENVFEVFTIFYQEWVDNECGLVFVTGRPEQYRHLTSSWLGDLHESCTHIPLHMRKDGDHRPDHIVKEEILKQLQAEGHDILCVFDDRKSVVDMWRRNGILCFQVAEGDF